MKNIPLPGEITQVTRPGDRAEIDCLKMVILAAVPDGARAGNVARALLELAMAIAQVGLERAKAKLERKAGGCE